MDNVTLMVGFALLMAVVGGYFVSRESEEFEPVRGGGASQVAHFLACAGMSGIPAALLVMLIVTIFTAGNLVEQFVLYVVVSLMVVLGSLLVYAVLEPADGSSGTEGAEENALPPLD